MGRLAQFPSGKNDRFIDLLVKAGAIPIGSYANLSDSTFPWIALKRNLSTNYWFWYTDPVNINASNQNQFCTFCSWSTFAGCANGGPAVTFHDGLLSYFINWEEKSSCKSNSAILCECNTLIESIF